MTEKDVAAIVATTQAYYDGPADEIYRTVWGDNLHLGVPCSEECPHPEAMEHTNEIMANAVPLGLGVSVLDLGCGYGSTARYLATNFGCQVTCVNISERELELAGIRSREAGLDHLLSFEYGDFHHLGYPDGYYDVVWSQEALLHAADKTAVLSECRRVLRPDGASSLPTSSCGRSLQTRTGQKSMTESTRLTCGSWKTIAMPCPGWTYP